MDYKGEASRRVRSFLKKVRRRHFIQTATGILNRVTWPYDDDLCFEPKRATVANRIRQKQLEKAAYFVLYTRTCTIKNVERFSRMSSALFGCLIDMFKDISRLTVTKTGQFRLSLMGIRVWLSGTETTSRDLALAASCGAKWAMFNFAYMRDDRKLNWKRYRAEHGIEKLFVDSGGFQILNGYRPGEVMQWTKPSECPFDVMEYASFLRKHRSEFFTWSNLDVRGNDALTGANFEYLCDAGVPPMPIWHIGSSSYEMLDEILRKVDPPCVGVGGILTISSRTRRYELLADLFDRYDIPFHGFGVCDQNLFRFPWHSVDMTAAIVAPRRYGKVFTFRGQQNRDTDMTQEEAIRESLRFVADLETNYASEFQGLLFP